MEKLLEINSAYVREKYDSRKEIFYVRKELDLSDKSGLYIVDILEYDGFELISIKFETAIECSRGVVYTSVPNSVFSAALKSSAEIICEFANKLSK